tara:strand:- start:936 stop:1223 length:288 start_codon:yes stop_codon:yes gene_type:complete
MDIDKDQIEHLASLIRVRLDVDEIEKLGNQLNGLVAEFNVLQEVDTDQVEPTGHIADLDSVLRPDETRPSMTPSEVLENAPQTFDNFIRVKRVIE